MIQKPRRGAGAAPYVIVVGLVAVTATVAAGQIGERAGNLLAGVTDQVNAVGGAITGNGPPIFDGELPVIARVAQHDPIATTAVLGFSDPEGDRLRYNLRLSGELELGDLVLEPVTGGVEVAGTPSGSGSFTVVATDPIGRAAESGPVPVQVDLNQPPVAPAMPGPFAVLDDDPMAAIEITGFTDPEDDTLRFEVSGLGALEDDVNIDASDEGVTLTGTPATPGTYEVMVAAIDEHDRATLAGPVILDVIANRPPTFAGSLPEIETVRVGQTAASVRIGTFADADGDILDYDVIDNGSGIADDIELVDNMDGTVDLTVAPTLAGDFTVSVTAMDVDGLSTQTGDMAFHVKPVLDNRACKTILETEGSTGDGTYTIDPDGAGGLNAFSVYCDMTTDGGGWTKLTRHVAKNKLPRKIYAQNGASHRGWDGNRYQTQDSDGDHKFFYTITFAPGYKEFYTDNYAAKAWSEGSHTTDVSANGYKLGDEWGGIDSGGSGDVGFGSSSHVLTSFVREGVNANCTSCVIEFPKDGKVYSHAQVETKFRIGWAEGGPQHEGWYPWWEGAIFLR